MSVTILIIDDEENARKNIGAYLTKNGFEVLEAGTLAEGREVLERGDGDIVLLDVQLPDGFGPSLLSQTHSYANRPPVIVITGHGDIKMAVDAMKDGAHDFITKPITDLESLNKSIQRACEIVNLRRELFHLRQSQIKEVNFVIGQTSQMLAVIDQAKKAAKASVSVLITGETGTGKDMLAQYIHQIGPRANKPYIPIDCGAIQPTVLESELFGYEAGAFTGAEKRKHGLMEIADTGILFLDEISSLTTDIQAKLLRAIEEQAFRRVGGTNLIKVDLQIIAASNRNLKEMIDSREFREDLYYRLKVVDLHLPALRDRKNDIPELVGFFIKHLNPKFGLNIIDISSQAVEALINYNWPGNIRELMHTIERAMLFCNGEKIDVNDLPMDIVITK